MLYRIITKNKNRSEIVTMMMRHFDIFTVYRATGVYKNTIEPALIIEIDDLTEDNVEFYNAILLIAGGIKQMNDQESVLVQKIETKSELI